MSEVYTWRGGSEMLLRHGAGFPITLLILPALFEEANRMRRFTVSVMRALSERGIGTILPDLPGTGESTVSLADVAMDDWRDAVRSLVEIFRTESGKCLTIAIRGGATLDEPADHGWRLAPETGERVLRDLVRATAVSSEAPSAEISQRARNETIALAGNMISPALYKPMMSAVMPEGSRRTARLTEDVGPRDISVPGTRLWRNSEPGDDPVLVAASVADIAEWMARCVAP